MRLLFDKEGNGAQELVDALGMVSDNIDFTKWKPVIPLAARQLNGIIGTDVLLKITSIYWDSTEPTEEEKEAVYMTQRAVAFFAWTKVIPTLDAQHGGSGRQKKLGENEKGLTALQEYKDEQNILNLAYEAVDALVECLEEHAFDFWTSSEKKRQMDLLLIRTKDEFDFFYHIGSHRMFLVMVPIMREIQRSDLIPVVGQERFAKLLAGDTELSELILEDCQRPLALLAVKKAVERLPIELIPDGVVQVQQTGSIKEKLRAEKEARLAVANSLQEDADRCLQDLQDKLAEMDAEGEEVDYYVAGPTMQSTGMTF